MVFTIQDRNTAAVPGTQSKIHTTDIAILLAGFSGTGVVSGCGVTAQGSPDMTVAVAAGTILAAGVQVAVTGGNLTVGTADGTNPRIDLISASAAGVKTITAGTAAAVATCKPPDLPSGHVGLAFVDVPAADTTIGSAQVTDKRVVVAVALAHGYATVATDEGMTGTSFADLATTGPAVTLTVNTKVRVTISADMYGSANSCAMNMGVALSGANTLVAQESQKLLYFDSVQAGGQLSKVIYYSGLTPGSTTFTCKYYHGLSGTSHWRNRQILVECLD